MKVIHLLGIFLHLFIFVICVIPWTFFPHLFPSLVNNTHILNPTHLHQNVSSMTFKQLQMESYV